MVDDATTADLDAATRKRKRTPTKNSSRNGGSSSIGCGADSLVVQKGRKLKQYVLEEKLDIIDYAKVIGNRAAGREFNVAESSIREWRKNEQRLRSMFETAPERSRLDGGGRRPVSEDLEKGLLQYVTSRSDKEPALTWHDIKEKANDLWGQICERNPEYSDRGFTANMGWVARFVRRNNITLQVTNSASSITPKLVSSSGSSTTTVDDVVRSVADFASNVPKSELNPSVTSSAAPASSPSSTASTVRIADECHNEDVATVATTVKTATATSVKKRRKNFIPKKVVANDVVCSATTIAPQTNTGLARSSLNSTANASKDDENIDICL